MDTTILQFMIKATLIQLFTIYLLVISFPASARHFYGRIKDRSGQGIAGARINVDEKTDVFYCNNSGVFSFNFDGGPEDMLIFSSQGYNKKDAFTDDLPKDSIFITLERSNTQLSVAGVSTKNGKILTEFSGCDNRSHNASSYMSMYDEIALYCPVDSTKNAVLNEIGGYITREGSPDNEFKMHIYRKDAKTGEPGEEITDTLLTMNGRKGNEWVTADVSNFLIQVKEGLFISMEWIPGRMNNYFAWKLRDWRENYYSGQDSIRGSYQGQVLGLAWAGSKKPIVYRRYASNKYDHKDEDKWFRVEPLKGGHRGNQWICPMMYLSYNYMDK